MPNNLIQKELACLATMLIGPMTALTTAGCAKRGPAGSQGPAGPQGPAGSGGGGGGSTALLPSFSGSIACQGVSPNQMPQITITPQSNVVGCWGVGVYLIDTTSIGFFDITCTFPYTAVSDSQTIISGKPDTYSLGCSCQPVFVDISCVSSTGSVTTLNVTP